MEASIKLKFIAFISLCRRPLQDVILEVWTMTEDSHDFQGIIPTIQDLPEAPLIENIDFSLKTLHKCTYIFFYAFENFICLV